MALVLVSAKCFQRQKQHIQLLEHSFCPAEKHRVSMPPNCEVMDMLKGGFRLQGLSVS